MADWTTRYNPFGSTKNYDKVKQSTLEYSDTRSATAHRCTDVWCSFIFFACLGATGYITAYAFKNGDPRKIYHGMDYEGHLCGVDLPQKPYVYWCPKTNSVSNVLGQATGITDTPVDLDFHHPICVEFCPISSATQSDCYAPNSNAKQMVPDYPTRGVGGRICLPQSRKLLHEYNKKLDQHEISKYLTLVTQAIREGWRVLLGVVALAFVLAMLYLIVIEFCAGVIIWLMILGMIAIPGLAGLYLLWASQNGGLDGIPHTGDDTSNHALGGVCCAISAVFLIVACCMKGAIGRAIQVTEAAAQCLVECRSLLLEPVISLVFRICAWAVLLPGLFWLISVGEVRKAKVYRTFEYSSDQWVFLGFYTFMFIWVNDFITATSQYVVANATQNWYFTECVGGKKSAPSCLLCRGYFNVLFHIGSLAFGSMIIAFTRPVRIAMTVVLYAGEMTDNAVCACVTRCFACCVTCFTEMIQHICKTAFIDMAITSLPFCAAGTDAAKTLTNKNNAGGAAFMANSGATWLFTIGGIGTITASGAIVTSAIITNVDTFEVPSSKYYVADPAVMTVLAGWVSFVVALVFMTVFDSIADTLFLCMAMESTRYTSWKGSVADSFKAPKKEKKPNMCTSFFKKEEPKWAAPKIEVKSSYATPQLEKLAPGRW